MSACHRTRAAAAATAEIGVRCSYLFLRRLTPFGSYKPLNIYADILGPKCPKSLEIEPLGQEI